MFRDKYRSDNEKITPDEALLKYLSVRMSGAAETGNQVTLIKSPKKSRLLKSVLALAACFALVVSAGGLYIIFENGKNQPAIAPEKITKVKTGVTYSELYSLIKSMEPKDQSGGLLDGFFGRKNNQAVDTGEGAKSGAAPTYSNAESINGGSKDYSKTNTQVEGVDEADIVKTDGSYIYTLANGILTIVSVDGAQMKKVSVIDCNRYADTDITSNPGEMYVNGDRLVVIKNLYNQKSGSMYGAKERYATDSMMYYNGSTSAAIYDIKDRANPRLLSDSGQSGNYLSSRMVGNTLYLISNHTIYETAKKDKPETYIPLLYDNGKSRVMNASDITISIQPQGRQYVVATSVDIGNPSERLSSKTVFGCGSTLYASTKNLLIASYAQNKAEEDGSTVEQTTATAATATAAPGIQTGAAGGAAEPVQPDYLPESRAVTTPTDGSGKKVTYSSATNLLRFSLNEGKIELAATGSVPGSLLNQFSMDEYNGFFRLVTTNNQYTEYRSGSGNQGITSVTNGGTSNGLYTLNQRLEIVGRIEDVAKGERVYSVRFNGEIGYFVTFRQVDPLFAVDLKNPARPKILSALKIPGFSDYLHPYSDGLLFGLGRDADEYGGVKGLKLSMFDVSDPADVSEKHKLALSDYWSEASYNHKAIVVSPERGLIAFPVDGRYMIFSYDKNAGFARVAEFYADDATVYYLRGLYIGKMFYICSGSSVYAYSMESYTRQATLRY